MGGKAAKERRRLQRLALNESSQHSEKSTSDVGTSNVAANKDSARGKTPDYKRNAANQKFHSANPHFNGPNRHGSRLAGGHFPAARQAGGRLQGQNSFDRATRGRPTTRPRDAGGRFRGTRDTGGRFPAGREADGRFHGRNLFDRAPRGKPNERMSRPKPETKKAKSKVKKPKHLKRKLEQADEENREEILNEMKQWEEKKKTTKSSTLLEQEPSKRQKTAKIHEAREKPDSNRPSQNKSRADSDVQPLDVATVTAVNNSEPASHVANKETQDPPKVDPEIQSPESAIDAVMDDSEPSSIVLAKDSAVDTLAVISDESPNANDSDSESDVSLNEPAKRQRGRRRRGRKGADKQAANEGSQSPLVESIKEPKDELASIPQESRDPVPPADQEPRNERKKVVKNDGQRRCIGRKPVTDFIVGQRYSGKVIYMKPFGVFIDIGCHSDAFCHVSRVQDDYIETPGDALAVGDEVSARIVEVDRKQKRLTVSLQSDAKLQDEKASMEAKRKRTEKQKLKKKHPTEERKHNLHVEEETNAADEKISAPRNANPKTKMPVDESQMTPAELKRARKLARRAERRAQKEETGISA